MSMLGAVVGAEGSEGLRLGPRPPEKVYVSDIPRSGKTQGTGWGRRLGLRKQYYKSGWFGAGRLPAVCKVGPDQGGAGAVQPDDEDN